MNCIFFLPSFFPCYIINNTYITQRFTFIVLLSSYMRLSFFESFNSATKAPESRTTSPASFLLSNLDFDSLALVGSWESDMTARRFFFFGTRSQPQSLRVALIYFCLSFCFRYYISMMSLYIQADSVHTYQRNQYYRLWSTQFKPIIFSQTTFLYAVDPGYSGRRSGQALCFRNKKNLNFHVQALHIPHYCAVGSKSGHDTPYPPGEKATCQGKACLKK